MSLDVSDIRRRIRGAIERARREALERRQRVDQAGRDYEVFLRDTAVPVFHAVAAALAAEGRRFKVFTPAGSVRLASDGAGEDFLEIALDETADPPAVIGRVSRGRGRRLVATERVLTDGLAIAGMTEDHVLAFLLGELPPFLER